MKDEYINITEENIANEHICCIIRTRKAHLGIEAKKNWIQEQLNNGHIFRKLNVKGTVFIEYAPLETAWVPISGNNYYYIYCLWVVGEYRGKGYAKELLEYCIEDAKKKGKSGICMLGSIKQKSWLSDQSFVKKYGFKVVDTTKNGYELLALSFDGTKPVFHENAKVCEIENQELTIYYDYQCPFIYQNIEKTKEYCIEHNVPASFIQVNSLQKAKELPCVFNNYSVFYKGNFQTVNLLDINQLERILKK